MKRIALLALFIVAGFAPAQSVKLPDTVTGKPGAWIIVPVTSVDGGAVMWGRLDPGLTEVPLEALFGPDWAKAAKGRVFTADEPGRYRVAAWNAKGDVASPWSLCTVVVGDAPEPPGPGPGPGPGPDPDPFTEPGMPRGPPGLKCLIVYETAELSKLPKEQLSVLYGAAIRGYLNSHCKIGPDGKTPEWRCWDQNVPTKDESPMWQKAMTVPRKSLPWMLLGNGTKGYSGPLPATVDETVKLMTKYGGP